MKGLFCLWCNKAGLGLGINCRYLWVLFCTRFKSTGHTKTFILVLDETKF